MHFVSKVIEKDGKYIKLPCFLHPNGITCKRSWAPLSAVTLQHKAPVQQNCHKKKVELRYSISRNSVLTLICNFTKYWKTVKQLQTSNEALQQLLQEDKCCLPKLPRRTTHYSSTVCLDIGRAEVFNKLEMIQSRTPQLMLLQTSYHSILRAQIWCDKWHLPQMRQRNAAYCHHLRFVVQK